MPARCSLTHIYGGDGCFAALSMTRALAVRILRCAANDMRVIYSWNAAGGVALEGRECEFAATNGRGVWRWKGANVNSRLRTGG